MWADGRMLLLSNELGAMVEENEAGQQLALPLDFVQKGDGRLAKQHLALQDRFARAG
jgi:hypothetical protein